MSIGCFIRFVYKCQVLSKTSTANDTGQRLATWSVQDSNSPCYATPASMRASIRVTPTTEQGDWLTFYIPSKTQINYGTRIANIKYRDKILYAGPYEVQDIKGMNGFSGNIEYYELSLKRVIE